MQWSAMIRELEDQHNLEKTELAPYATHNISTRGRRHPEKTHPFRTVFQRGGDDFLIGIKCLPAVFLEFQENMIVGTGGQNTGLLESE